MLLSMLNINIFYTTFTYFSLWKPIKKASFLLKSKKTKTISMFLVLWTLQTCFQIFKHNFFSTSNSKLKSGCLIQIVIGVNLKQWIYQCLINSNMNYNLKGYTIKKEIIYEYKKKIIEKNNLKYCVTYIFLSLFHLSTSCIAISPWRIQVLSHNNSYTSPE